MREICRYFKYCIIMELHLVTWKKGVLKRASLIMIDSWNRTVKNQELSVFMSCCRKKIKRPTIVFGVHKGCKDGYNYLLFLEKFYRRFFAIQKQKGMQNSLG